MRALGLALIGAALLQACATTAEPSLAPVASNAHRGARIVSMLVVSTRKPSPDPAVVYTGERGESSFAMVDVSIPPNHQPGQIELPEGAVSDPSREFAVVDYRPGDDEALRAWRARWTGPVHALIFVHGFNNSFARTVFRLAQFVDDARLDVAPVLFAWPSAGSLLGYLYDRESANYSRDTLERTLHLTAIDPQVREVTVLAHSMGTWLAMEALRQYAIRNGAIHPKVRNVILASPDLDGAVFLKQFQSLGPSRPQFTFLISQDDRALQISRLLAGGERVGLIDPSSEQVRTILEQSPDLTLIDMTGVQAGERDNHGKFMASPAIVKLVGERLMAGGEARATQAASDLPDTARGALLVITAPLRNLLKVLPGPDSTPRPPAQNR